MTRNFEEEKEFNLDEMYGLDEKYHEYYAMPHFYRIGRVRSSNKWLYSEHLHTDYEWIYIIKGKIKYRCCDNIISVEKGDFYFIQPGQTHQEESSDEELDFIYLKFYYIDLKGKVNYLIPPPGDPKKQVIRDAEDKFYIFFNDMYNEANKDYPGSKQVIEAIILQMIWLVRRNMKIVKPIFNDGLETKLDTVKSAIEYILHHKNSFISLSELSIACSISPYYLSHIFKEITGMSPLNYAARTRMDEAKKILKNRQNSIAQIAEELGFTDQFHFSRFFKKIVGLSPTEFRDRIE